MSKPYLLDANLILRYTLCDIPKQAEYVQNLLMESDAQEAILLDAVLIETIFTLVSFYKLDKQKIVEAMRGFIMLPQVNCNREVIDISLSVYARFSISIVDAYICATAVHRGIGLETFDKKLTKVFQTIQKK